MKIRYSNLLSLFLCMVIAISCSHTKRLSDSELSKKTVFSLQEAIKKKKKVVSLYLNDSTITTFPSEILQLKDLQSLSFSDTKIETIHAGISTLSNLYSLDLSWNKELNLYDCFEGIKKIENLTELSLVRCEIEQLPLNIGEIPRLEKLYLYWNNIKFLPEEIGRLDSLKILLLEGNELSQIPHSIINLQKLEAISLNGNKFEHLPEELSELNSLKDIYLGNPELNINQALVVLSHCKNIELIDISNMRITKNATFQVLGKLNSLKTLSLIDPVESFNDLPTGLRNLDCKISILTTFEIGEEERLALEKMNPLIEARQIRNECW